MKKIMDFKSDLKNTFYFFNIILARSVFLILFIYSIFSFSIVKAETFSFSPLLGTYAVGSQISVDVLVSNTDGPAGAVSGLISFPKNLLSVSLISKRNSVVDRWTQEPSFSNTSGVVNFEGAFSPPGFTGDFGKLFTIVFEAKSATGTVDINFIVGSILAINDVSKNILLHSSGATFNISEIGQNEQIVATSTENVEATRTVFTTHSKTNDWYSIVIKNISNRLSASFHAISNWFSITATAISKGFFVSINVISGWISIAATAVSNGFSVSVTAISKGFFVSINAISDWIYIAASAISNGLSVSAATISNWYSVVTTNLLRAVSFLKMSDVFITSISLLVLLIGSMFYKSFRMKNKLKQEVHEAEEALHKAFNILEESEQDQIKILEKTKPKSPKTAVKEKVKRQFKKDLKDAEKYVEKEVEDIEKMINK